MQPSAEPPRIDTVVGARYRVAALLGTGGMGAVYRAEDLTTRRAVALKILRPHLGANEEACARFRREAVVGGKLLHPNCVGVTDIGTSHDGAIYLAMELLDGESLGAILTRERRIPWQRALRIARHVLHGLAHAHQQGIVHRDIKPDNIFVNPHDGDPHFARILDFGIAKLVGGSTGPAITQAGLTIGTPHYVSPEQALGGELDGRSDLYSLSIVLFEMLTGTTPFVDRDIARILVAHATRPLPSFAEVAPDLAVPPGVEALVRDGVAKRADERISSAAAYVARIDALLAPPPAVDTVPDGGVGVVLEGRYRLEALLGRGAWGRVYRASHVGIGRPVAIKVLDPQVTADDDARRRFEREAQATGRLQHPNCVAVTDFGATPDGSPYLAMELADGVNLADVVANQARLPVARAVHIVRHILRGLAHAHGHGLVHRDLKPPNIMLVSEGGDRDFAKILDFGLARMVGADDRVTRTGIVAGTPSYMSPEQVLDRRFDARTDLYAMSVILFEMIAGRTPFEHDDLPTLLKMHLAAPVPRIADVAPDVVVPRALDDLIRRGLAKRPEERPASADEYLDELDRVCAPPEGTIELSMLDPDIVAVTAPPPKPPIAPPVRRRTPTRRELVIGGVVASIVVVGIIAAFAGGGGRSGPAVASASVTAPADDELELEPETAPTRDPEIVDALRLAQAGRGEEAASRLRDLRRRRPDDPSIPYALGRVYKKLGWPKQTIDAYREALRIDPGLRDDPQLIGDLVGLLESRSSWQVAARVLEREVGAAAIPALDDAVARHRDATVQRRAAQVRGRCLAR